MANSFFLRLLLGHLIGDFILQPYWLVLAKRSGWKGLIIHVGVVTFITAILVWAVIPGWWIWVIVLYIGHLFIDQFRTFVFTDNTRGKGLLLLIADQIVHVILIGLLAWAAVGWTAADLSDLVKLDTPAVLHLLAYLCGAAALIGVVPILEVEIAVAIWAFQGTQVNHTVAIERSDRVLGSLERIIAVGLWLGRAWYLMPLVFIPRLAWMIYQGQARKNRTMVITKTATSFFSALVVGIVLGVIPVPRLW